ncbi:5-formyltetrahydrofolate cyclo-ligase [Altererythrobacter sp. Root672]|uniref:5-formyltetrahydrofolate cyclo-ligase n=1 Tax=Altererythrobacter sp. Root672 TaxID=1736584 RepID=UPI0006FD0CA0|nr:5-formyltetrahydrofolate cyclo-ligase [Altererythrobacter sp. Root672]KRA83216.1 5-formyltetrahydrofolate cyclo-ligase [Altererythrobacter sp. Root672]
MSDVIDLKKQLRTELRRKRREHAEALPPEVSALVFNRPPGQVLEFVPEGATIGLYRSDIGEAPSRGYIRFFFERGNRIALPRVTTLDKPMEFRLHTDPYEENDLESGVWGLRQPGLDAPVVVPEVLFMPLVGFTAEGDRLGQGGGYYDRYLAAHPQTIAIGMAWDVQELPELPIELHDMRLSAIVTPTRVLGPF